MSNFVVKIGVDVANGTLIANSSTFQYGTQLSSNGTALIIASNSTVNAYITSAGLFINGVAPVTFSQSAQYTFTNTISFSNTVTFVGGATINSTSFSGLSLTSNNASFLNGNTAATFLTASSANSATAYSNAIAFSANATNLTSGIVNAALFNTTGNVQFNAIGVNTTVPAVNGQIRATDNVIAYYSSDEQLKTNITLIQHPLDKLNAIDGVEFDWTTDYIDTNGGEDGYFIRKHDIGVIAQQLNKILPEVVGRKADGYLGVKYERIVPLLIEAIKELHGQVKELQGK